MWWKTGKTLAHPTPTISKTPFLRNLPESESSKKFWRRRLRSISLMLARNNKNGKQTKKTRNKLRENLKRCCGTQKKKQLKKSNSITKKDKSDWNHFNRRMQPSSLRPQAFKVVKTWIPPKAPADLPQCLQLTKRSPEPSGSKSSRWLLTCWARMKSALKTHAETVSLR